MKTDRSLHHGRPDLARRPLATVRTFHSETEREPPCTVCRKKAERGAADSHGHPFRPMYWDSVASSSGDRSFSFRPHLLTFPTPVPSLGRLAAHFRGSARRIASDPHDRLVSRSGG